MGILGAVRSDFQQDYIVNFATLPYDFRVIGDNDDSELLVKFFGKVLYLRILMSYAAT